MPKIPKLILLLCISAVYVQAEPATPASDKDQKSSALTTMQGCLHTDTGQYILTEPGGTSHLLSGAANKLGHVAGREVELTGKPGVRTSDTTSAGGASSVVELVVFEVKTVKELASECKSPAH